LEKSKNPQIEQMMDIGIDKKTMGSFLGFVDPPKYRVALIGRGTHKHPRSGHKSKGRGGISGRQPRTAERCRPLITTNQGTGYELAADH